MNRWQVVRVYDHSGLVIPVGDHSTRKLAEADAFIRDGVVAILGFVSPGHTYHYDGRLAPERT